jgi:hypothetical protein
MRKVADNVWPRPLLSERLSQESIFVDSQSLAPSLPLIFASPHALKSPLSGRYKRECVAEKL